MTTRGRLLDPEKRAEVLRIRAAARRGMTAAAIAESCQLPLAAVTRTLASSGQGRVTEPAVLLGAQTPPAEHAEAAVQLYWVGFLTASGRISGQGPSTALVITLGDRAELHMTTFIEDLVGDRARHEYCESSLLGWQVYVREPNLCRALLAWGVPSDAYGGDPALVDDLPARFAAPFMSGYLDGNWPASAFPRGRMVLNGTADVLSAVSRLMHRCWEVQEGRISSHAPRATLTYPRPVDQQIWNRARSYAARER